jgi:hypothetical protein
MRFSSSTNYFILILLGITLIYISGYVVYRTWTLGNDNSDYKEVCIGDHVYYRANFAAKMAVAIKLNANGNPIPCISENVDG